MMNTDVITIYQKQNDNTWKRTVKDGVQWSDHIDKTTNSGRVSRKPYATITLFDGFEELGKEVLEIEIKRIERLYKNSQGEWINE